MTQTRFLFEYLHRPATEKVTPDTVGGSFTQRPEVNNFGVGRQLLIRSLA